MHHTPKVIAIAGGKGGVGKSLICGNLAVTLAQLGQRVLVFDADLGLANMDVLFNLKTQYHLGDLLKGECELDELIVAGPYGIKIAPAGSGEAHLATLSNLELRGMLAPFASLYKEYDYVLIDMPAGVGTQVSTFCMTADHIMVVVCDEPSSMTDAYGFMKIMSKEHSVRHFHLITNQVATLQAGASLFKRLEQVADDFLDVQIMHRGTILHDPAVTKAIQARKPICDVYPSAPSVLGLYQTAKNVMQLERRAREVPGIEFFAEASEA